MLRSFYVPLNGSPVTTFLAQKLGKLSPLCAISCSGSIPLMQGVNIETTIYINAEMNATHKDIMMRTSNQIIVHKTRDKAVVSAMISNNYICTIELRTN